MLIQDITPAKDELDRAIAKNQYFITLYGSLYRGYGEIYPHHMAVCLRCDRKYL